METDAEGVLPDHVGGEDSRGQRDVVGFEELALQLDGGADIGRIVRLSP